MEVALLILRIVAGLLFAGHGAQKLFGWFGGGGVAATGGMFEQLGLRPGQLHAAAGGFNEFAGGLLIAAGFLTPIAAALVIANMSVAVIVVHAKNGPWAANNGWELNALYAVIAFAVAGIGAGDLSLDGVLGLHIAGIDSAIGSLAAGFLGGVGAILLGRAMPATTTADAQSAAIRSH